MHLQIIAFVEEVRDVLVKILGVVDGSSVGNELLLGAHLVPKRLAQTSLGFIAKEQQIDSGEWLNELNASGIIAGE